MPSFWMSSRLPARGSCLGRKPPLAPEGTMTAFLTSCARTSPKHLGAEILRAVRPADAAARDRRKAQMDALDARRVDPDLAEGSRLRGGFHGLAVELEGEGRLADRAGGAGLVEVGAHGGADQVQELAQDAVLVEARHARPAPLRCAAGSAARRRVLALAATPSLRAGIEAQVEQLEQIARYAGVAVERVGQIAQAERASRAGAGRRHRP